MITVPEECPELSLHEPIAALWPECRAYVQIRARKYLYRAGIHTVGELLELRPCDLLGLPSIGGRSVAEVQRALAAYGLNLRPDPVPEPPRLPPSLDLSEFGGITYRQLDWWARAGYLKPFPAGAGFRHAARVPGQREAGCRHHGPSRRCWPVPGDGAHRVARSPDSTCELAAGVVITVSVP